MTSPFADTSKIDLKILLDSVYKAEQLIRKFVSKHLEKPTEIPNKCKLRMNNPNIRIQYFGLMMFYQQIVLPYFRNKMEKEAETEIANKWRADGKEPYFTNRFGVRDHQPGFMPEVRRLIEKLEKSHEQYGRARIEETRLSSADNIIKGGPVESELPSGLDVDEDGESKDSETPPPKKTPDDKEGEKIPNPDGRRCPGEYCGGVKKSTSWRQGGGKNKWYCQFCWGAIFGATEDEYIRKIKGLDKLTEEEKQFYINQIYDSSTSKFESIWVEAESKNQSRKDGEEEDEDDNQPNLSVKIAQAIQEIEAELDKEPKIFLEKDEDWRIYIEASLTLTQLQGRKNEILAEIRLLRQKQKGGNHNLVELRNYYINLIKSSLNKNPPISLSELSNPNWETQISQAQKEQDIKDIGDKILAEIGVKRKNRGELNQITELLSQARQEENWNNYQKLSAILQQIKKLRSSNAYQSNLKEIQALEKQLQKLNPTQFQETNTELLNQQIKNAGLTEKDLDKEAREAIERAKIDPSQENRQKAEEGIAICGAKKELDGILEKVDTVKTEEEKKKLVGEILTFMLKNKYSQKAYELAKSKVEQALRKLKGEGEFKGVVENKGKKPDNSKGVMVAICVVIGLLGVAIVGLAVVRKRKKRGY